MKKLLNTILPGLSFCSIWFVANAQTPPRLSITNDSPTSAQISWTNVAGTSYRVWSTLDLAKPFSPLEDAFSDDTNLSVRIPTADAPAGFFRVQIPTNGTLPAVQIFSPTNNQTVSGEISIGIGAQIGSQLEGANLYLDDALVGFINSGGIQFRLDTTHFTNGLHTVYVGAVSAANNETLSSSITLDFENPVRWLDACSMFNSSVPIDVDSDIYPADWMVAVTDTNNVIVRTISGTTDDGIIQTNWDGTDDSGQPLPEESLYQIEVFVASQGSSMSSSLATESSVSSSQETFDPLASYSRMLENYENAPDEIKKLYPPLPSLSVLAATTTSSETVAKPMSLTETFLAEHSISSLSEMNANSSSASSGYTKTFAWWESPWSSGQTLLARVPIPGSYNTVVQNYFLQIQDLIETATDSVGGNRGVYGSQVYVIQSSNDFNDLTNHLTDSSARDLYFYEHGNANGNVIGTTSAGISAKDLGKLLRNYYYPSLPKEWEPYGLAGKPGFMTHHPYSFVFLDGCNTALGDFPEAFGIPKTIPASAYDNPTGPHLHKRAFIGWTGPVTFQFDNVHFEWTQKFWEIWMQDGYNTTVTAARNAAYDYRPSVNSDVPDKSYGSKILTWSD